MPDWKKLFQTIASVLGKGGGDGVIPPRCYICGKGMHRLSPDEPRILKWRDLDAPVYRCENLHEFSPGNYAVGVNPSPPEGADQRGEP